MEKLMSVNVSNEELMKRALEAIAAFGGITDPELGWEQASDSGNYDDAFDYGLEQGEYDAYHICSQIAKAALENLV